MDFGEAFEEENVNEMGCNGERWWGGGGVLNGNQPHPCVRMYSGNNVVHLSYFKVRGELSTPCTYIRRSPCGSFIYLQRIIAGTGWIVGIE